VEKNWWPIDLTQPPGRGRKIIGSIAVLTSAFLISLLPPWWSQVFYLLLVGILLLMFFRAVDEIVALKERLQTRAETKQPEG
jgi:protein-S-isoprenylcysteine O-methyltransferase Ste14